MRECMGHGPGRAFLALFAAVTAAVAGAPFLFGRSGPLGGFVPWPFAAGFLLVVVLLPSYLAYYKRFWPFR